jgi:hypothetical protein
LIEGGVRGGWRRRWGRRNRYVFLILLSLLRYSSFSFGQVQWERFAALLVAKPCFFPISRGKESSNRPRRNSIHKPEHHLRSSSKTRTLTLFLLTVPLFPLRYHPRCPLSLWTQRHRTRRNLRVTSSDISNQDCGVKTVRVGTMKV